MSLPFPCGWYTNIFFSQMFLCVQTSNRTDRESRLLNPTKLRRLYRLHSRLSPVFSWWIQPEEQGMDFTNDNS